MLTESPPVPPNKWSQHVIDLFSKKVEDVPDASADTEMQEEEEDEEEEEFLGYDDDYDGATPDEDVESDADAESDGSDCSLASDDTPDGVRRAQERANQVVKDFLEQVRKNEFTDFKWPPPPKCPTYKYGMTVPYVREFDFENRSDEYYDTAKNFLKQVRTSWGYDVDCTPPRWLRSPFIPINLKSERHMRIFGRDIKAFTKHAIEKINAQAEAEVGMGKSFELVRTEKAVSTHTMMLLLTLTIKEKDSCAEKAVRVAVSSPPGWGTVILECKLIPSLSSS